MINGHELYSPTEHFVNDVGNPFYPVLEIGDRLDEGTYGVIYKARRAIVGTDGFMGPYASIVSKQTPIFLSDDERALDPSEQRTCYVEEIQALLFEATLHVLAHNALKEAGHPTVVPEILDVLADAENNAEPSDFKSIWIQMEYVHGENLHTYFQSHLKPTEDAERLRRQDLLVKDVLIQLCVYMDILQTSLFFNHRDLKLNNVLRRRSMGNSKVLQHPSLPKPWTCLNDLAVIDFGFSCVACEDSFQSLIQAGSWFREDHDCLKGGRDMALFIYCLHCCFPLRDRISKALWEILENAMVATWGTERIRLLNVGVDSAGNPRHVPQAPMKFDAGIYRFLRHSGIEVPGCEPKSLMASLAKS
jgi:serine/threonine protein kinase